jgi:phosphoglycerate dehydrogenase-like enzyme
VLVFDPIRAEGWSYDVEQARLEQQGVDLVVAEDAGAAAELVPHCDVLVSSGTRPVTAEVISRLPAGAGILCYSAGRNAVDEVAAARAGITVAGVHAATEEVADHAMALLLAVMRLIVPMSQAANAGDWSYADHPEIWQIPRLSGRILGVVGAGHVGRAVAMRARAFGLRTIATYHRPPVPGDPSLPHVPIADLFARADIVVLTAALTEQTAGIVDAATLGAARPGLVLVNVARGGLIDEEALADALDRGIVAAAGLDVRVEEPPDPATDRLTGRPNVVQTPHIAGASSQARHDLHVLAADGMLSLLADAGRLTPAGAGIPGPRSARG